MKLLLCPYCGEIDNLERHMDEGWNDNFVRVRCMNCGALGPDASTWLKAQECWNERKEAT